MIPIIATLFLGFLVVTIWGWRSISEDRRFPVAFGVPPSIQGTMSKPMGLIVHLLIGACLAVGSWFAASQEDAMGWVGWIGIGLLAYFLLIEIHTIRRLSR